MAASPRPVAPLTPEGAALVASLEVYVDGELHFVTPHGSIPIVLPLPVSPNAAVAAELRRRYLSAGWSRVLVGERPDTGEPFIQLEASVDVLLSGRPT